MWRVVVYAVAQSALLAAGQVFLKFGLARMLPFGWNRQFWMSALFNWQFAMSGLTFGASSVLWMHIVKRYPLSVAYPMTSIRDKPTSTIAPKCISSIDMTSYPSV